MFCRTMQVTVPTNAAGHALVPLLSCPTGNMAINASHRQKAAPPQQQRAVTFTCIVWQHLYTRRTKAAQ